jgi:hypothetical protein
MIVQYDDPFAPPYVVGCGRGGVGVIVGVAVGVAVGVLVDSLVEVGVVVHVAASRCAKAQGTIHDVSVAVGVLVGVAVTVFVGVGSISVLLDGSVLVAVAVGVAVDVFCTGCSPITRGRRVSDAVATVPKPAAMSNATISTMDRRNMGGISLLFNGMHQ